MSQRMAPAQVPKTGLAAANCRRGSVRFSISISLSMVVLSPPGMIKPSHGFICEAVRTSTALRARFMDRFTMRFKIALKGEYADRFH